MVSYQWESTIKKMNKCKTLNLEKKKKKVPDTIGGGENKK